MNEEEKKYDVMTIVLMTLIALPADVFSVLGLFMFPVPIIGIVVLGLAVFVNFVTVALLGLWFIMKHERSLIVWLVILLGFLLGLILPIKFLVVLLATFVSNSRLVKELAEVAAAVAVTALTGGTAAPAAAGAAARGAMVAGERLAAREAAMGARAAVAGERAAAGEALGAETAEAEAQAAERAGLPQRQISEEEFGVQKEPLERLKEVMEQIPEPEEEKKDEENI